MRDLKFLSKDELMSYFKELQPTLKWDLNKFTCLELRELTEMHFSTYEL